MWALHLFPNSRSNFFLFFLVGYAGPFSGTLSSLSSLVLDSGPGVRARSAPRGGVIYCAPVRIHFEKVAVRLALTCTCYILVPVCHRGTLSNWNIGICMWVQWWTHWSKLHMETCRLTVTMHHKCMRCKKPFFHHLSIIFSYCKTVTAVDWHPMHSASWMSWCQREYENKWKTWRLFSLSRGINRDTTALCEIDGLFGFLRSSLAGGTCKNTNYVLVCSLYTLTCAFDPLRKCLQKNSCFKNMFTSEKKEDTLPCMMLVNAHTTESFTCFSPWGSGSLR